MDERATGLIVRTRPLTETSLIVHWLTAEHGRLATVARGARRPKSPLRGKLDLFFLADFSFARSRRSELHTLREVNLRQTHPALRRDLALLQQAAYAAALVEQTTETDTPLPEMFILLQGLLEFLPGQPATPAAVFAFEMKMLGALGLAPDMSQVHLTPGARQLLLALAAADWLAVSRIKPSRPQEAELRRFLHGFLLHHLGRIAPGRAAALGGAD
jgi:DNA repair protein RecO (recombination protein O)